MDLGAIQHVALRRMRQSLVLWAQQRSWELWCATLPRILHARVIPDGFNFFDRRELGDVVFDVNWSVDRLCAYQLTNQVEACPKTLANFAHGLEGAGENNHLIPDMEILHRTLHATPF